MKGPEGVTTILGEIGGVLGVHLLRCLMGFRLRLLGGETGRFRKLRVRIPRCRKTENEYLGVERRRTTIPQKLVKTEKREGSGSVVVCDDTWWILMVWWNKVGFGIFKVEVDLL